MGNSLKQLYESHTGKVTDKWSLYLDELDQIFEQYQNQEIRLLEIGVQNGGSLEIWSKYFVNARKIVGCDIDENCRCLKFDDDRINVIIGNANTDQIHELIAQQSSTYDIIIDDGSHMSSDIIHSFLRYFQALTEGGVYVVEDLHASYWVDYEGGLYNPYTAMAFFKRIADVINFEHWRNNTTRESIVAAFEERFQFGVSPVDLEKIHSIEFTNSLCVIKKAPLSQNELGLRVIAGDEACAADPHRSLNNSSIQIQEVRIENDSTQDVYSLIGDLENLTNRVKNLDMSCLHLNDQVSNLQDELNSKIEQIISLTSRESAYLEQIAALKVELDRFTQIEAKFAELIEFQTEKAAALELAKTSAESRVETLENEVVHYVSSKSWKYTRPFRKLYGVIRRFVR